MNKYFGSLFYSDYFQSWCVVVRVKSDSNWFFVVENRPYSVLKAKSKLSDVI